MSYSPQYTSETKIEGYLQIAINDSTDPTTTELLDWIEEIETDADQRMLGSYTLTDFEFDVPATSTIPRNFQKAGWLEWVRLYGYDFAEGLVVIPPYLPIVSVSSLSRRTSSLTEAKAWEALTEGPAANSSWVQLKKKTRSKQFYGFAIFFYDNIPIAGIGRLKMTYNYGWNLPTAVIREWCTLKVVIKTLEVLLATHVPFGTQDYGVMDIRVTAAELKRKWATALDRIAEIEAKHFPTEPKNIGVLL